MLHNRTFRAQCLCPVSQVALFRGGRSLAGIRGSAPAGRSPFGELLIRFRNDRGMTQEGLASAIRGDRISTRSVTNWESKADNPRDWILPHRPVLRLLADALELDRDEHRDLVHAWSTTRSIRSSATTVPAPSTFVMGGRKDAFAKLVEAWARAQQGLPQLVFVGGVSGIGKTAIARHLSDHIAASCGQVMISWGEASAWATALEPYLPMRTAMDRMLAEPDPASSLPGRYHSRPTLNEQTIARIVDAIPLLGDALVSGRVVREMAARSEMFGPTMLDSLLMQRSSTETSARLEEYSRLLVDLARQWPVVLVLEDLHWAGSPVTMLLQYLARTFEALRDTPILIVVTYRSNELLPDSQEVPHPLAHLLLSLRQSPNISHVHLNSTMQHEAAMAYLHDVLQRTPLPGDEEGHLADWLYEQASGHPMLTGELLRDLIRSGALVPAHDGDRWRFLPDHISPEQPAVISAFVEQRLAPVNRRPRRVLEVAAVMDDTILTEIIADVMQTEEEEILELIEHHLVEPYQLLAHGDPVRLPRQSHASYRFPHALFREHVYASIPVARRKRLHLAIAQAMEQRFPEPDTTILSEMTIHFVAAEDWHSAQMTGYRLAQHAGAKLDWDLSALWYTHAENLALRAQDPQQLWRARAARLAVLRGTGNYDEAVDLGEKTIVLSEQHDWPFTRALAYHHLGEVYYDLGQVEKAVSYLTTANRLHLELESWDLAAASEAVLSHATYRQGAYDVSRAHAQSALVLSRRIQNSWVQPEALLAAANCEVDLGFYDQAIERYRVAIELATMIGKLNNQLLPAMNIGLCLTMLGRDDEAIVALSELCERMESQRITRLLGWTRLYLGYAYEGAGRYADAAQAYAASADIRRATSQAPTLYDSLAGVLRMAMQHHEAEKVAEVSGEIVRQIDGQGWEGIEDPVLVMMTVARACASVQDTAGYERWIRRAHELLMLRAGMIEDEMAVDSYLNNVPVNRELRRMFAALTA